jgi:hypothetical protein
MRLTKNTKQQILANVLSKTFKRRADRLEKDGQALGDAVYKDLFDDHKTLMEAMPEGFLYQESGIKVKFGAGVQYVNFSTRQRLPHKASLYGAFHAYNCDHVLSKTSERLVNRQDKLSADRNELKHKVRAILNSATTDKRLLEVWPEVEPFLPKKEETKNLPAIPVADLNSMIASLAEAD